ncbi:MAG: response regulator receiver [Rhodoferax sp.]|nr:response regulator receiver [Rhodoferax sp.]
MRLRIYIVEDSAAILENLTDTLRELAFAQVVGSCGTEAEGKQWLQSHPNDWDLAIVDLFLTQGSGLDLLAACRQRSPEQKIVLFSNYANAELRKRCELLGVDAVFDKSTEIELLIDFCLALRRGRGSTA